MSTVPTLGDVPDRSGSGTFIGRTTELATISGAIDEAHRGRPSVLLIGGEPGIGKSALLEEAVERAGVGLYLGRCIHIGGDAVPLAPLIAVARRARRVRPDVFDEPALGPLTGLLSGQADTTPVSGGLLVSALELVGRLPGDDVAVVAFEDLHQAHPATWDLFEFIARGLIDEQVVLIGTFRADEVTRDPFRRQRLAELTRLPGTRRLHLDGLARGDVAAHIEALTGTPPPPSVVDEIEARGRGNPLFTQELVSAKSTGEAIPPLLFDLIVANFAALGRNSRQVVAAAAVVGRDTNEELLSGIVDFADTELEEALLGALSAQVLVTDPELDLFRFRHPLMGEVVYAELLPSERQRLHRRAADALRTKPELALTPGDVAGELAVHLGRSGDRQGAFDASLAAADAASGLAPATALDHLERALDLWNQVDPRSAGRGARLWQAAELASAIGHNERAIELGRWAAATGPHPSGSAYGHERLGRYLWAAGEIPASREEYRRASELIDPEEANPDSAAVFAGIGQAELMQCHFEIAGQWAERALGMLGRTEDDPGASATATRVLGLVCSAHGRHREAVDLCRRAASIALPAQGRALARAYLVIALCEAALYEEAVDVATDAASAGRAAGLDRSFGGYLAGMAAEALVRLGRWKDADTVLGRVRGLEASPIGVVRIARATAMLAARRGDADRARAAIERAATRRVDPLHELLLEHLRAEVALLTGQWSTAADLGRDLAGRACADDARWPARLAMISVTAEVELALDRKAHGALPDPAALVARLERELDLARRRCRPPPDEPPSEDCLAHLDHAAAELTRVQDPDPGAWARAGSRWSALGDSWASALAQLREAEAAAALGGTARAAAALRHSYRTARGLSAGPLLAELGAVSRRTRISLEVPEPDPIDADALASLGLTRRESEVLDLLAVGKTNREIGKELYISEKTASVHVSNILRKLEVETRFDAAAVAQRLNPASQKR